MDCLTIVIPSVVSIIGFIITYRINIRSRDELIKVNRHDKYLSDLRNLKQEILDLGEPTENSIIFFHESKIDWENNEEVNILYSKYRRLVFLNSHLFSENLMDKINLRFTELNNNMLDCEVFNDDIGKKTIEEIKSYKSLQDCFMAFKMFLLTEIDKEISYVKY